MSGPRKLFVKSYGCQMNVYDSNRMADVLAPKGFIETATPEDADLVIETGPAIKGLMAGEISPAEAIKSGIVHLIGDRRLLKRFVEIFHIAPMPEASAPKTRALS